MTDVRIPEWLRRSPGLTKETVEVKKLLRSYHLNTVCEEARCPNICECFAKRTATFLILGDICTRGCHFCSVTVGKPEMLPDCFDNEASRVASAAKSLNLRHVVVTSVTRDDLEDGGASGFVKTINALKNSVPTATIEVLIPDFAGNLTSLKNVLDASPTVLNHNIETIKRLYPSVRPKADYHGSLKLLQQSKSLAPHIRTKTGIMLGLGETESEVIELMMEARAHDVDIFTAGQYMQPSKMKLQVAEYVSPNQFDFYASKARELGFKEVAIAPLVRSSYLAEEFVN